VEFWQRGYRGRVLAPRLARALTFHHLRSSASICGCLCLQPPMHADGRQENDLEARPRCDTGARWRGFRQEAHPRRPPAPRFAEAFAFDHLRSSALICGCLCLWLLMHADVADWRMAWSRHMSGTGGSQLAEPRGKRRHSPVAGSSCLPPSVSIGVDLRFLSLPAADERG
jgi:hypothetical protein